MVGKAKQMVHPDLPCDVWFDGSEKAARAQESKKGEIYCDGHLAKEVVVVMSCLTCPEHHQAALGSSELQSCWMCSSSEDTEVPTRRLEHFITRNLDMSKQPG